MIAGGHGENDTEELTRLLLARFDGDTERATAALREYADREQRQAAPRTAPSGPVIVSVEDVRKSYKVGRQKLDVLNGVTFGVREGEFVAITGASGSGKSTLLQLIGGLDKPTSGKVMFGGTDIATLRDAKLSEFRRQTVGFVFQFFYLQPFLRVATNLEVPAMFARTGKKQRSARAAQLSEAVGMADRTRHFPRELSGGQMQRAAIARALMNNPKILLADEPTGNLDSKNGDAIISLFEAIRDQFGTTIIVVTHDPAIARRADREIRLKDGALS